MLLVGNLLSGLFILFLLFIIFVCIPMGCIYLIIKWIKKKS